MKDSFAAANSRKQRSPNLELGRILRLLGICFLLPAVGLAQGSGSAPARGKPPKLGDGSFVFSLLPRAFQRNPLMDLNVVTDMTAEGRKQTPPSVEKPAYYVAQSAGYRQLGLDSPKEDPLAGVALEGLMKNALASAGFLPATADHPATLALIYHWGSHNNIMNVYERNILLEYSITDLARSLIERATLVGGEAFAKNLARALEFSSRGEILSFVQGGDVSIVSELGMFLEKNPRGDFLAATISGSIYFVVVSAYDFAAMARGGRQLLWRTKMTVSTDGVSMKETLPPLIVSAAPHLGRETNGVETILQRLSRGGTVTIGDPKVIEYFSGPAAPPSSAPKNPPKP